MAAGRFSVEAVFKAVDRMSRPIRAMGKRVHDFTRRASEGMRGLDKVSGKFLSGLKTIGTRAAAVAAAAGAAMAAMGASIVKAGADFEQQITNVGAVSLMTRDQIKELEVEALRLGAVTKFSATEAAAGMELMAKAGFTNAEIMQGIGGVLNAAAAEGAELAETANHVSNVLKGMGLQASEATRVADVLALASARTNSSIGSLGESMANVASTARQFKIPLEEVVGSVALLQDVGLDASVAGSAMNTMLTNLTKPTKEVHRAMRQMGVTFQDSKGNMLPLQQVFANMAKAAEKSGGNMKQVAFFADLVGLRGQKAAANLADLFKTGKVSTLFAELEKAAGSAEKMAAIKMDTFTGDMLVLEAAVDSVKVALFDTQNGPLRKIVQGMSEWVSKNKEAITSGFVKFLEDVQAALPEIVKWGRRIGSIVSVFTAAAVAVKIATAAMAAFNAVMAANPITLIAVAIVAAIALIVAFWPEISAFFSDVWSGIVDIAGKVAGAVGGVLKSIFTPMKDYIVGSLEFLLGVWTLTMEGIGILFGPLVDIASGAAGTIIEMWRGVGSFFADLFGNIVEINEFAFGKIGELASSYVETWKEIFGGLYDFFTGLWSRIFESFTDILGPVFDVFESIRGVGAEALGTSGGGDRPQVVPPEQRLSSYFTEANMTTTAEVTIRDETGKAAITKKPRKGAVGIDLRPSGSF